MPGFAARLPAVSGGGPPPQLEGIQHLCGVQDQDVGFDVAGQSVQLACRRVQLPGTPKLTPPKTTCCQRVGTAFTEELSTTDSGEWVRVASTCSARGPDAVTTIPNARITSVEVDPNRIDPLVAGIELMTTRWVFSGLLVDEAVLSSTTFEGSEHPALPRGEVGVWLMKTQPCVSPPQIHSGSSMNQSEGTEICTDPRARGDQPGGVSDVSGRGEICVAVEEFGDGAHAGSKLKLIRTRIDVALRNPTVTCPALLNASSSPVCDVPG